MDLCDQLKPNLAAKEKYSYGLREEGKMEPSQNLG